MMKILVIAVFFVYMMAHESVGDPVCKNDEDPVILDCDNISLWNVTAGTAIVSDVIKAVTALSGQPCKGSFQPGGNTKIKITLVDGADFKLQKLRVYMIGAKKASAKLKGDSSTCDELPLLLEPPANKTKFVLDGVKVQTNEVILDINQKSGETLTINKVKIEACKINP